MTELTEIKVNNDIDFIPLKDGRTQVIFTTDKLTFKDQYSLKSKLEGQGTHLDIKVCKQSKKRSLTANAYMWVLLTKIAEKLSQDRGHIYSKEEIYKHYIEKYGASFQTEVAEEHSETLCKAWSNHGLGWFTEKLDNGEHDGYILLAFYYGTSCYSSKRLGRIIDSIIEDCKELEIETMPTAELQSLINSWKPTFKRKEEKK